MSLRHIEPRNPAEQYDPPTECVVCGIDTSETPEHFYPACSAEHRAQYDAQLEADRQAAEAEFQAYQELRALGVLR